MPVDKTKATVGMLVQDWYGNVGTVRWFGKMEKAQKPPNKDTGTYAAVEFATPNEKLSRTDGTWEGTSYAKCPPKTCEFIKLRNLEPEQNIEGIKAIRAKYGEKAEKLTDGQIVKFLIARKYDTAKTIEMIDNHLKWRVEYQPTADEFFPPEMADEYPVGIGEGVDREGNIIQFERPGNGGKEHPKNFVKHFGLDRICRWHVAAMEEALERLRTHPTARRVTAIVDLSNFGDTDKTLINFGKALAKIDQDNYPEHLNRMYIINAPGFFTGLWRVVRLFIDDRTKEKIKVLGKDFQEEVTTQIDPKYWPSFMGGTDDSWFERGGRIGSFDESKARDPSTGAIPIEEVTDKEVAAAQAATTPQADAPPPESPATGSP